MQLPYGYKPSAQGTAGLIKTSAVSAAKGRCTGNSTLCAFPFRIQNRLGHGFSAMELFRKISCRHFACRRPVRTAIFHDNLLVFTICPTYYPLQPIASNDFIRWEQSSFAINGRTLEWSQEGEHMELRLLRTFRAVAERLNFTRAAEDLHLAQSSVSAQIRLLEEDLGVSLFDRIGRRILLTEAGETLLHYARRMEAMSDEIRNEIAAGTEKAGSLTIRIPETVAAEYMPAIVEDFHDRHPKAVLNFINCDDARLREELNSGRIDLAFLLTDEVTMPNVTVEALRTESLMLVAAPQHPLSQVPHVTTASMHGSTILHLRVD